MMTTTVSGRRLAFAMFGALASSPASALAAKMATPFGEMDESCVNKVPRGAHIDAQSGDVSLDGARVAQAVRCSEPVPGCSGSGGWYDYTQTVAKTISGLKQFNYYTEYWTIPTNPSPPGYDSPLEYYFPSLQAFGTDNGAIIQPVLSWGLDAQEWEISAWALLDCNTNCTCTTYVNVTAGPQAGDTVYGAIEQYAGNPDAWEIYITTSSNWYAETLVDNIPNSWPKFTVANSAVNENYGLVSCQDLSPQNYVEFYTPTLFQAGPNWNSHTNVTSSAVWSAYQNPNGYSPNCGWLAGANASEALLVWSESD